MEVCSQKHIEQRFPAGDAVAAGNAEESAASGEFAALYAATLEKATPGIAAGKKQTSIFPLLLGSGVFAVSLGVFSLVPGLFSLPGGSERNWFSMGLCAAVMGTLAWYYKRRRRLAATVATLRETVIQPIARHVAPELRYADREVVARETFDASLLFDRLREPDMYDGTGVFYGELAECAFRFTALTVVRAACHGCRIRRGLLFEGMFWEMADSDPLDGYVVVTPKAAGVTIDIMQHRLRGRDMKEPQLLSRSGVPNFDREFAVFASDMGAFSAFAARKAVWTLLDLRGDGYEFPFLSVIGNTQYLAVHTGRRHFHLPRPGETLGVAKCDEYRRDIQMGVQLAEAFCRR